MTEKQEAKKMNQREAIVANLRPGDDVRFFGRPYNPSQSVEFFGPAIVQSVELRADGDYDVAVAALGFKSKTYTLHGNTEVTRNPS